MHTYTHHIHTPEYIHTPHSYIHTHTYIHAYIHTHTYTTQVHSPTHSPPQSSIHLRVVQDTTDNPTTTKSDEEKYIWQYRAPVEDAALMVLEDPQGTPRVWVRFNVHVALEVVSRTKLKVRARGYGGGSVCEGCVRV